LYTPAPTERDSVLVLTMIADPTAIPPEPHHTVRPRLRCCAGSRSGCAPAAFSIDSSSAMGRSFLVMYSSLPDYCTLFLKTAPLSRDPREIVDDSSITETRSAPEPEVHPGSQGPRHRLPESP